MRTPHHKRRGEHKGFDLLEAAYAEKGLISTGDSARLISAKAIGDTHAHSRRHHLEKEKKQRASFTENVRARTRPVRASFLQAPSAKQEKGHGKLPPQKKKPDEEDPAKEMR